MLLEDDFFRFEGGPMNGKNIPADTWPPPEHILATSRQREVGEDFVAEDGDVIYALEMYSQLTDEESASMSHVCRGALYKLYVPPTTATGIVESLIHVQEAKDV